MADVVNMDEATNEPYLATGHPSRRRGQPSVPRRSALARADSSALTTRPHWRCRSTNAAVILRWATSRCCEVVTTAPSGGSRTRRHWLVWASECAQPVPDVRARSPYRRVTERGLHSFGLPLRPIMVKALDLGIREVRRVLQFGEVSPSPVTFVLTARSVHFRTEAPSASPRRSRPRY